LMNEWESAVSDGASLFGEVEKNGFFGKLGGAEGGLCTICSELYFLLVVGEQFGYTLAHLKSFLE